MKNIIYFFLLFVLCINTISAQLLIADKASINFGSTFENSFVKDSVTFTNNTSARIDIDSIIINSYYGSKPFYTTVQSFFVLPNATWKVYVYFKPVHNIYHNGEMIISCRQTGAIRIGLSGIGNYSKTYYNTTYNLSEEDLKLALKNKLNTSVTSLGYNNARDVLYMNIDNKAVNGQGASVNTLECVYTGNIITNFTNRTEVQNMGFNCEHTWPQSFGAASEPMQSDLHHLYPCKDTENTLRSNDQFDSTAHNGFYVLRPVQRGKTARSILYFATRYYQNANVDMTFLSSNNEEKIMRNWIKAYPSTNIDYTRNNTIFSYQNNRNPYVDYPQFLDRITVLASPSVSLAKYEIKKSHAVINFGNNLLPNTNYQFDFAWTNNGNRDITVSNIRVINNSILNVSNSTNSIVFGDGITNRITLNFSNGEITGTSFTDTLMFDVLIPTLQTIKIPITGSISTVGIIDLTNTDEIKVLPNPCHDIIHIKSQNNIQQFEIFDINGKFVLKSNEKLIDISTLKNGMYKCFITMEDKIYTTSIIKI
jgi:hypothetical protein